MMNSLHEETALLETFVQERLGHELLQKRIQDLKKDMQVSDVTVTVLGEFKKGKSTLINALIRKDFLPMDVLPATAVMHKINHGTSKKLKAFSSHGMDEHQLHGDVLKNFTYTGNEADKVRYLAFETDLSHVHDKLQIIDTPGVGDLHDHQFDVTYDSIPRADVVIFTLDLTAPIRKTELDYLRDSIMPMLTGEILFVGNYSDRLDEDEYEEVLYYMERKLKKELGQDVTLLPVSSLDALENPEEKEWVRFEAELQKRIKNGARAEQKQFMLGKRLELISAAIEEEVGRILALKEMDGNELERSLSTLTQLRNKKNESIEAFTRRTEALIADQQEQQKQDTKDFILELKDSILDEIELKLPDDLEVYFEKHIPKRIEKSTAKWMKSQEQKLHGVFEQLKPQMVSFFETDLQEQLRDLSATGQLEADHDISFLINPGEKKSTARVQSGAVTSALGLGAATVGGTLFAAVGGLLFIPAMMIGGPFISDYYKDQKKEKIRQAVRPQIEQRFEALHASLDENFDVYIEEALLTMQKEITEAYLEAVQDMDELIRDEINQRETKIDEDYPVNEGDWDECLEKRAAIRQAAVEV